MAKIPQGNWSICRREKGRGDHLRDRCAEWKFPTTTTAARVSQDGRSSCPACLYAALLILPSSSGSRLFPTLLASQFFFVDGERRHSSQAAATVSVYRSRRAPIRNKRQSIRQSTCPYNITLYKLVYLYYSLPKKFLHHVNNPLVSGFLFRQKSS